MGTDLRSQGVEGKGKLCLPLHRHRQKDPCIRMGSDHSHFNVSLIVRDSHKTVSSDHSLFLSLLLLSNL